MKKVICNIMLCGFLFTMFSCASGGDNVAGSSSRQSAVSQTSERGVTVDEFPIKPIDQGILLFEDVIITQARRNISVDKVSNFNIIPQVGHSNRVPSAVFSPDGKFILSGSVDRTLKLWDINTGREIRTFSGHTDRVIKVAFSNGGKLALSTDSRYLKLWDVETGQEIREFPMQPGEIYDIAFSPDSRQVCISSSISPPLLKFYDTLTGEEISTISGRREMVRPAVDLGHGRFNSIAYHPDGRYILTGSSHNKTISLWDITSGREIRTFIGHNSDVNSVAFNHDGKYIISGGNVDSLRLWDVETGRLIKTFSTNIDSLSTTAVAFSPDGKYIVSGDSMSYKKIRLWDIATGREIRTFSNQNWGVSSLMFSPDGKLILESRYLDSTENSFKLWDISTGRAHNNFTDSINAIRAIALSSNGKQIIAGFDNGKIILWDITIGSEVKTFIGHTSVILSVAFSPDGKHVLSGSNDNTVKLWDTETGEVIRTFTGYASVDSVAFSPNGNFILTGSGPGRTGRGDFSGGIRLWDIATGREIWNSAVGSFGARSATFNPGGEYILAGGGGYDSFTIWDTATGRKLSTYPSTNHTTLSVAFSSDGKHILAGSEDASLLIWDITTAAKIRSHIGHSPQVEGIFNRSTGSSVNSVAFSPDGKTYLSGSRDRTLKLWVTSTGQEIYTFIGHTDEITSVVFSPDGKQIFSSSRDGTIRLWDVATGK